MIFSGYRASDYHDVEGFAAQLALVLSEFADETVRFVSDPRTGIQRRSEFPPGMNAIVAACEQHEGYLDRVGPPRSAPMAPRLESKLETAPGSLAQAHVPQTNEHYAALCERAKKEHPKFWEYAPSSAGTPGIRVPLTWWPGAIASREVKTQRTENYTWEASETLKSMLRERDEQGRTETEGDGEAAPEWEDQAEA